MGLTAWHRFRKSFLILQIRFTFVCLGQGFSTHRCRNRQIFGGAKEFCPDSPKLARKIL